MTPPGSLGRLYLEELKALPRGRFALTGATVLAAFLLFQASMIAANSQAVAWVFGLLAYLIVPSLFAPLTASWFASARSTLFLQSVFTSPVRKGTWLVANVLALLTAGALYLLATLPFVAIMATHPPIPHELPSLMLAGLLITLLAVGLGAFLGLAFTGRSVAAPVGLSAALMGASFLAAPFSHSLLRTSVLPETLLRVLHASPHVLLMGALDLGGGSPWQAARPGLLLVLFGAITLALYALAAFVFLRAQGIGSWEGPTTRRVLVAIVAATLLLAPPIVGAGYEPAEAQSSPGELPPLGSGMVNASAMIVPAGGPIPPFGDWFAGTFEKPLAEGATNAVDLLVLVKTPAGARLREARLDLEGTRGLLLDRTHIDVRPVGALATAEHRGPSAWSGLVLRIPLEITTTNGTDLTSNFYGLKAKITYRLDGETTPREASLYFPIRADVPGVRTQFALAGAPLVLLTGAFALTRRLRHG